MRRFNVFGWVDRLAASPRRVVVLLLGLALLYLLLLPAVVYAVYTSTRFNDLGSLPTGDAGRQIIDNLANAGITAGCVQGGTGTTSNPALAQYCPQSNVTREQMAIFMTKLGGRLAQSTTLLSGTVTLNSGVATVPAAVTLTVPGTPLTTTTGIVNRQFVLVQGTANVFTVPGPNAAPCPCTVTARVLAVGTNDTSSPQAITLDAKPGNLLQSDTTATALGAFIVPAGSTQTFRLLVHAFNSGSTGILGVDSPVLVAQSFPFNGDGTNAPLAPVTAPTPPFR